MKNKILTTTLATLLIVSNVGTITYYNNELGNKDKKISKYKEDIETKSTEIAKLGNIVEDKKKLILDKDMVIDSKNKAIRSKDAKISELREINENNKIKINNLQSELTKKKETELKQVITSSNTSSNKSISKSSSGTSSYTQTFSTTAYTNADDENGGRYNGRVLTATGYDVTNTTRYSGYGVVASDPSVLPLYSIIEIEGLSGQFIVLDTGGAIKGNRLDIMMSSKGEARNWGRRSVGVKIIKRGS